MDPNHHQRPAPTAYYPSPPSVEQHSGYSSGSPSTSRPPHMMAYDPRGSMQPPPTSMPTSTPTSMPPTGMAGFNGLPPQPSVPPAPMQPMNGGQPMTNGQSSVNGNGDSKSTPAKQNRLSKACDGCSVRKVKCDEEGPPCRACRSLQIPCTFNRPSRRRGPPNRHAEAIKRQKLEFDATNAGDHPSINGFTNSPTTPSALGSPANLFHPTKPPLSADSIAPFDIVTQLIDDFFTYVHPLHPIPHEPSFRTALFQERRDIADPRFLALVASMIGVLVSTYPRRPLQRLKAANKRSLFRSSQEFVSRCRDIALEGRGDRLFAKKDLNVTDAVTAFFLGVIATNTYTVSEGELYFGECFNILRALGHQRFHDDKGGHINSGPNDPLSFGQAPTTPQHVNVIEREISHRLYWSLYEIVRNAFTFGFGSGVADINMNPSTPLKGHPPMPLEVDDEYIHPDHVDPQPPGTPTTISALNHINRMHVQYEPIKAFKMAWCVDEGYDKNKQNELYRRCMSNAQSIFEDSLPAEYRIEPANQQSPGANRSWDQVILSPSLGSRPHLSSEISGQSRRQIGIEIRKASIHATHLTTRAFYMDKYWSSNGMKEDVIGMTIRQTQEERLRNGRRLLDVLTQTPVVLLEPLAFGFCMQVRQVASTLYSGTQVQLPKHSEDRVKTEEDEEEERLMAQQRETAQAYVNEFLKMLVSLEKGQRSVRSDNGNGSNGHDSEMDEDEELRRWTDMGRNQDSRENSSGSHGYGNGSAEEVKRS